MTGVLKRQEGRQRPDADTQGELGVKTEAETGAICPQAEECQEPPATPKLGVRRETDSPRTPQIEEGPADTLIFAAWPPELWENKFLVL